jgi:hypothetical protein
MKEAGGAHIYTARARTLRCACNRLTTSVARPSRPLHDEKVRAENNFAVRLSHTDRGQARFLRGTTPLVTQVKGRSTNAAPRMKSKTVLAPSKGLGDFAAENRSYQKQSRRFGCQWPAENHDLVGLTIGRSPGSSRLPEIAHRINRRSACRDSSRCGNCDQPPLPPRVVPPVSLPKTGSCLEKPFAI